MSREYFKGSAEEERSYSPAVKVAGGTTVYLAGVGATTDDAGRSLAGDFEGQTRATFERVRANLERARRPAPLSPAPLPSSPGGPGNRSRSARCREIRG